MTQKEINWLFASLYIVLLFWLGVIGVNSSTIEMRLKEENEALKQYILRGCKNK